MYRAMKRKRREDKKEEGQGEKVYHRTEMKSQSITLNHISIILKISGLCFQTVLKGKELLESHRNSDQGISFRDLT